MESPGLFWLLILSICALQLFQLLALWQSPGRKADLTAGECRQETSPLSRGQERKDGKPAVTVEAQPVTRDLRQANITAEPRKPPVVDGPTGRNGGPASIIPQRNKEQASMESHEPVTVYMLNDPTRRRSSRPLCAAKTSPASWTASVRRGSQASWRLVSWCGHETLTALGGSFADMRPKRSRSMTL